MVPQLWPRVGKKDKHFVGFNIRWHYGDQILRTTLQENDIIHAEPVAFLITTIHPPHHQIDTNTELFRVVETIRAQPMSVPTANLQRKTLTLSHGFGKPTGHVFSAQT